MVHTAGGTIATRRNMSNTALKLRRRGAYAVAIPAKRSSGHTMHSLPGPRRIPHEAATLLVLGALFVAIQYALPGLWPHPIRPDDYANVGSTFADMGLQWKRPASANLIFLVAGFGPAASYAFLCALAVIDALLVLWLLARVFAVRVPPTIVVAFGIAVFSHVSAFSHATYLGLLTNLISHFFGLSTLFALWQGWRTGRAAWWVSAAVAFVLSAFAKEDFLLPPMLFLALLFLRSPGGGLRSNGSMRRGRWLVTAAIAAIAAGSLLWNAHDRNPFVAGLFSPDTSAPIYAVDLSPGGLARAAWKLLVLFDPPAFAAAALAWGTMFFMLPRQRLALLWYAATVLSLALPYAMISRNMPSFRVYAWLPWYAGLLAVAFAVVHARGESRRGRIAVASAAIAGSLLLAAAHWPQRTAAVAAYAHRSALNRSMVQTLRAHHAMLTEAPVVGLVGLGESSPWCAQDAAYVNGKLGFGDKKWVVFVPAPTRCYTQQAPDVRRKRGIYVSVVEISRLCGYGAVPVLEFAADGSGRLKRADEYCGNRGARG